MYILFATNVVTNKRDQLASTHNVWSHFWKCSSTAHEQTCGTALISGIGLKCRTHKLLSRDVMADILPTFIRHWHYSCIDILLCKSVEKVFMIHSGLQVVNFTKHKNCKLLLFKSYKLHKTHCWSMLCWKQWQLYYHSQWPLLIHCDRSWVSN